METMAHILRSDKITETAALLRERILERFPESGLSEIADHVHRLSDASARRVARLTRVHWPLRIFGFGTGSYPPD